MTIQEAAFLWNLTEHRVTELCKSGRIPGACKEGRKVSLFTRPAVSGKP